MSLDYESGHMIQYKRLRLEQKHNKHTHTMMSLSRRLLLGAASRHVVGRAYTSTLHLFHQRAFSSTNMTVLPPNLEFDKRSTFAPTKLIKKTNENENHDDDDDDDVLVNDKDKESNDEDDDEQVLFVRDNNNNSNKRPKQRRVIPLPDRLHIAVYDKMDASQPVGTLYLSERLFGHDVIRVDLLKRAVVYQRNQKRGKRKAKTKTISEVSGSGRKVRPQKGSGKARAGHSRPPHWRGGAKAHGPKGSIQDYSNCKINKHVKKLALTHALSQRLKEQNIIVLNDLQLETHKTKEFMTILEQWNIAGRNGVTCDILDDINDDTTNDIEQQQDQQEKKRSKTTTNNTYLPINLTVASQNINKIRVSHQLRANVYDILRHEKLILTVNAVMALEKRLEGLLRY